MKDISLKDKITQGINDLFYIWKRDFVLHSATRGY